ncbi:lysophospholipid acyltransferase family protein [Actinopolymorpha alba]|uniref:lysophospholipid acyltransferase family protein n=1 Tax=Actinopolymorpha alba TaxID=533267 RepID=UPI000377E170|nr:lysophospholipid acyltransferase family protein [Actinopolymorpha alba]
MPLPETGLVYDVAAGALGHVMSLLTKRDWRGSEHLPAEGGVLVVTNHLSYFDPAVIAHFLHANGRAPRFLAKASLFDAPVLGWFLRSAGQIPVHREKRTAGDALDDACKAIERGESVVVYPEGTITRDPALWPMTGKTGVVRIALRTGCDIVPVAQWGAQDVLLPYAKIPKLLPRKTMRVSAGPAVDLSAFRGIDATPSVFKQATNAVMETLTGLLAQLRDEEPPANRFDPGKSDLPSIGNPYKKRARQQ